MATAALAGCELSEVAVPKTVPEVVVHSVLTPTTSAQVVYLERTLTGAVRIRDLDFDPANPIATGGGIAITGAVVEIIDTTGRVSRGVEDKTTKGVGTGVYRVTVSGGVRLGAKYRLHVHTAQNEDATAETRVPMPATTSAGVLTRTINRDHDTVKVTWPAAAGARAYAVRVETPFSPFLLFTDTTSFRLTGSARNLFAPNLEHVLVPGFSQDMVIGAVDSNFYDYYRTTNDPFTGSGIISRVEGGLGLFGSMVTLTSGTLSVVADQTEAIEGRFRLTSPTSDFTAPTILNLYVESKSSRSDVPDALSGRYTTSGLTAHSDGIIGERSGSRITLVMLANQLVNDTVDVFTGTLSNGTLTGTYRKRTGTAVFVKS